MSLFRFALLCCLFVFIHAGAALAAQSKLLTWAPPAQTEPTRYAIRYGDSGMVDIIRDAYPYGAPKKTSQSVRQRIIIKLKPEEDATVSLPPDRILKVPGVAVNFGRHVRVIGGHIQATVPADDQLRAVLRFAGQSGSVFVEGLVLDANKQYGLDGILVGSVLTAPTVTADVYIQNTFIKNLVSTEKGLHSDGFQYYGATKWTRMDRVSIEAQYQGLFLDPQADLDGIDLRRVDLQYSNPRQATGYLFYLRSDRDRPRRPPVRLEDVYVGDRTNMKPWENSCLYPPSSRQNGAVRKGNAASFPAFPEVEGVVTRGTPPKGSWVKDSGAGFRYKSPGYLSN